MDGELKGIGHIPIRGGAQPTDLGPGQHSVIKEPSNNLLIKLIDSVSLWGLFFETDLCKSKV